MIICAVWFTWSAAPWNTSHQKTWNHLPPTERLFTMLLPKTKDRKLASGLLKNGPPHIHASMKRWIKNRDVVAPIFKFSKDVRKIIYTTNAIESLNSRYRKLKAPAQCVPKRPGSAESFVSCNFWSNKKMDAADSQLGADLRRNVHNVRRPPVLLIYKKSQLPKEAVVSVLLLIKNQQYFIFKKNKQ